MAPKVLDSTYSFPVSTMRYADLIENFDNTKRDFAPTARDVKQKVATASAQRNTMAGSDYKPMVDMMVSTGQGVKDKEARLDRMAQNTAKSAGMNAANVEKDLSSISKQRQKRLARV